MFVHVCVCVNICKHTRGAVYKEMKLKGWHRLLHKLSRHARSSACVFHFDNMHSMCTDSQPLRCDYTIEALGILPFFFCGVITSYNPIRLSDFNISDNCTVTTADSMLDPIHHTACSMYWNGMRANSNSHDKYT